MRELKGDWRDLFNGFMIALDLRKCFLGLCGIAMTVIFCGGITIALGNKQDPDSVQVPQDLVLHKWWNAQCQSWHVIYKGDERTEKGVKVTRDKKTGKLIGYDPEPKTVNYGGNPWVAIAYSIVFILVFTGIWSYFGGAIARIAAYEIAKDGERIETRKALAFSRKKFWSFFWAPLICVIGLLFFAFCNYVGGFVGGLLDLWKGFEIGSVLVAVLLPLAILSGFIMTLIAVGTLAGFPLFAPAVAAEGTDSFDAVSRGFSYVYSRPWHYLWYLAVTWGYGYLCIAFVILFAVGMCHLGLVAGGAGFELCGAMQKGEFKDITNASWALILSKDHDAMNRYQWDPVSIAVEPHPYGRIQTLANQIVDVEHTGPYMSDLRTAAGGARVMHRISGFLVTFWLVITLGLGLGYVASYFISQSTMIYYVLRKKVDGIEMNEVFEEAEEEAKPAEAAKPAEVGKPADAPKADAPPPPAEPPKA